jgi:hypothetical protein
MRFWYSRLASTGANQMLMVAIGWQMYDLTGSAWALGLVGLLQFLPALLLVLVAGHVVDQFDRARIVALSMFAQVGIAATLAVGTHLHWASRDLLLVVSVLLGIVKAFQMPAQQALAPALVPPAVLPRALAFSSMGSQAAIIAGPALGGFIYVGGAQAVYAVCALLFGLAAVLVRGARYDHVPGPSRKISLATLMAGVHFVRHRPVVLGAISLDLFAVLLGGATALLPIFAKDILHTGPWPAARRAGRRRVRAVAGADALADHAPRRPRAARRGRALRCGHAGVRAVDLVRPVDGRARRRGRGRHGQRRDPPVAGAARHARRHARPRQRRQLGVHWRVEPARRVRIGRDRGAARAGRLGAAGRHRHADRGRSVGQAVPAAVAA